ncbi:polysaccharide pyruvyl transferase family protein [Ramlibacter terrae]|uniref:Polysaccharide pyruvyl transferase family protein n=1 Tax=Ramlibacter terrae TaxID=2732511 RepID=A0ABX6NZT9_9BURK|nr:polysaccharide pyruvyl transferase family protein [Ramlibacter terrae]
MLLGKAGQAGWSVTVEGDKSKLETEAIAACDAVLVNGEGTMHSAQRRAAHLMGVLAHAQEAGKRTVLCNTCWFGMGEGFAETIRRLDYVSVRDPESAALMQRETGRTPELHIDLSFWQPATPAAQRTTPVLATDFYSREFGCFVEPKGGAMAALPKLDMRATSWAQSVAAISGAGFFVTGRFHGMMIALKTRTPFVAFPGNTRKVESLLDWLEGSRLVVTDYKRLRTYARGPARDEAYYDALFDRAHAQPEWAFPL